jgi:hypothetical protein
MMKNEMYKTIQSLKFTALQAYLRNTGWVRIVVPKPSIALFQKTVDNDFYEVLLPLSKHFADYTERILEVVEGIAASEQRAVHQILTDLSLPPSDLVRFRVINPETWSGTISFLDGFRLLESAKKALFTTACDILQPEKYHKRLGLKGAQQFIEQCRLGQTEKGSFVASVLCPFVNQTLDEQAMQLSFFDDPIDFKNSFTRQVTVRLMQALAQVKTAIDNGEENRIIDLEGDKIISANFLESIVELNWWHEQNEVEIGMSWSQFAPESALIPRKIRLSNDYIPVFEKMIHKIKPKEVGLDDIFIGRISQVKADPDPNTRTDGEIILNYFLGEEEKVSKARVILEKEAYRTACEAHQTGQTVRIKGKLLTIGRSKMIENPSFEIV